MSSNKKAPKPKPSNPEETKAIFLNTLSAEQFQSMIMPLDMSLCMYHVNNTDMCISDEDSSPELNVTESKDVEDCKPAATKTRDSNVDDHKPAANDSKVVVVKKEDVELVPSVDTTEVSTQTSDYAFSPNSSTVSKLSVVGGDVDSPHSSCSHSTARSSRTLRDDDDNNSSDSDPEVDKATLLKKAKKARFSKKASCPMNYCDLHGCRGLLAPPRKPMSPQDVILNKRCDYCGRCGDDCLNMRYSRYCIAVCYCYYHNNRTTFTQAGIMDIFKANYKSGYNRNLFLKNSSLTVKTSLNEVVLPGCLESCSLIYAINMVLWEYMIAETERLARYKLKLSKSKPKSKPNKK